jgi:NCS1 family nucleobase:cation symporter-1
MGRDQAEVLEVDTSPERDGVFLLEQDAPSKSEVGRNLSSPVPQSLGWLDQLGLWGNVGVSLLGFTGAMFVLQPSGPGTPELSIAAGFAAIVIGTLLGAGAIALSALPGTRTGAPAMVLLRGLLGLRGSYVPTVLNIVQCLGWGTFEIVVISAAAHTVLPALPRDAYVLIAGVATTVLALRPLGWVRLMRRVFTTLMLTSIAYLAFEVLSHPVRLHGGGWSGFFLAMDTTIAVAVSWVPLAADYSRHSRSERITVGSILSAYSIAQTACYGLGFLALITVARQPSHVYGAFVALPFGALAFGMLVLRETDQSFTDTYSTVASLQNLLPRADRRLIALGVGALLTVLGLVLNIADYENFLFLIGSVFVPLFGVLAVDFFFGEGRRWDLSEKSRGRPVLLVAWLAGFFSYQLINPGGIGPWAAIWTSAAHGLGLDNTSYLSASIVSFLVSGLITALIVVRPQARKPASTSPQREGSNW